MDGTQPEEWRVAAFAVQLMPAGPLLILPIRGGTDEPGACLLCGEPLPPGADPQWRRCAACVAALCAALERMLA